MSLRPREPKHKRATRLCDPFVFWRGRRDSNPRPPGSKIDGLGETQFAAKRKQLIFKQSLAGRPLKSRPRVWRCCAKVPQMSRNDQMTGEIVRSAAVCTRLARDGTIVLLPVKSVTTHGCNPISCGVLVSLREKGSVDTYHR